MPTVCAVRNGLAGEKEEERQNDRQTQRGAHSRGQGDPDSTELIATPVGSDDEHSGRPPTNYTHARARHSSSFQGINNMRGEGRGGEGGRGRQPGRVRP